MTYSENDDDLCFWLPFGRAFNCYSGDIQCRGHCFKLIFTKCKKLRRKLYTSCSVLDSLYWVSRLLHMFACEFSEGLRFLILISQNGESLSNEKRRTNVWQVTLFPYLSLALRKPAMPGKQPTAFTVFISGAWSTYQCPSPRAIAPYPWGWYRTQNPLFLNVKC